MKKKVALLAYSLGSGGAERQISYILKNLHEKFEFTLVLMNRTIFYDIPPNINVLFLENSTPDESGLKKLTKLPYLALKYKKILQNEQIDISLSFLTRPNYINALAKLFGSKTGTIISERSMFSLQYSYNDLQSYINKKLVRLYNVADMIITNSRNNGVDLQKNFHIVPPIRTIYNAVDNAAITKLKEVSVSMPGSQNRFRFITVGRLDKGKNHRLLIEAVKDTDASLYIIGDGPLKAALLEQIEALQLQNRVFLLGRQHNPYAYLSRADCFVFGSNHEGMPNVLLEALACNLPVISTDCQSGPREILAPKTEPQKILSEGMERAEYGILTPVNDTNQMYLAMTHMIEDAADREHYRSKSMERAKQFGISAMVQQFGNTIDTL